MQHVGHYDEVNVKWGMECYLFSQYSIYRLSLVSVFAHAQLNLFFNMTSVSSSVSFWVEEWTHCDFVGVVRNMIWGAERIVMIQVMVFPDSQQSDHISNLCHMFSSALSSFICFFTLEDSFFFHKLLIHLNDNVMVILSNPSDLSEVMMPSVTLANGICLTAKGRVHSAV